VDRINNPALPPEVRKFARAFQLLKYVAERYLGYLVLGVLVWAQWHQSRIKSAALITLYYAESTEGAITNLETNQRGFLYTGDPDLLEEYIKSKAEYLTASHHLENALADDPDDCRRLREIESVVKSKIDEMDQSIRLYRSGNEEAARQLVLTRQGQRYMTAIRRVLNDIRTTREIRAISAMDNVIGIPE
jgi:CHASE3 domain sensor protein